MTTLPPPSLLPLAAVLVAALLAACDSGPSQTEYLAVCLKEG